MAVNLLSLARASAAGLHNSGRGSGRSYAPGTSYGNKIAGTNIRQGAGLSNLASKGREGDTRIRKVQGRPSHVSSKEASLIDSLGPLGEAWVERIGSGTINPRTGLEEYFVHKKLKAGWNKYVKPLGKNKAFMTAAGIGLGILTGGSSLLVSGALAGAGGLLGHSAAEGTLGGTWKPNEGKWGPFGQTGASKERDTAKTNATARHNLFEDFRRDYEDENIAGIFTESTDDNTDLINDYSGSTGFNTFVDTKSGLEPKDNDIGDYLDEYDERKETELQDSLNRDLEAMNIASEGIEAKAKGTGTAVSSGLFGMLTQSQDTAAQKGFAGSGDFAADFAKTQALKEAETQFGGIEREKKGLNLEIKGALADTAIGVQDLQEDYNQEFWNNMVRWDSAVNT